MESLNRTVQSGNTRPPIVVVLGHVDHGKTTLLDYIRRTNVAASEVGGITQGIGASVVTTKEGRKITFVDTPGHAAFTNMRASGAKISDIAILVVAADDGVKPQTKEALEYILSAQIPFIVAATKIDLPTASIERVRNDLEKEQVLFEGRGGDVPLLAVSGKTGEGVEELLEMILLLAELHGVGGSKGDPLEGVVYETGKDRRGIVVNIVVKKGVLRVGDRVFASGIEARVRNLFDWGGKPIKEVLPGEPTQILGFEQVPEVGSKVVRVGEKVSLEVPLKKSVVKAEKEGKPIFVKAKNAGSLEALVSNLPEGVLLMGSGIGDLTESDIFMAKSTAADIYLFESKIPSQIAKLAQTEGVRVRRFDIIYQLFEKLEEDIKKQEIEFKGKAGVLKIFPLDDKKVAGCKVSEGVISLSDKLLIVRGENKIGEVRVISMKRGKQEITSAKQGEECGIVFSPQVEFEVGDVLLSVGK